MGYSNDTIYTSGGEIGGLGLHKWHCLSCPWTHTTTGGLQGKKMQDKGKLMHIGATILLMTLGVNERIYNEYKILQEMQP